MELEIRLGDVPVGLLSSTDGGDATRFRMYDRYRERVDRPVLGQVFEDDLHRTWRRTQKLPPFFSNLLPEGPMREFLAERVGVHPDRELLLLAHLGNDLPGNIRVVARQDVANEADSPADPRARDSQESPDDETMTLRFSLAGVQIKFSLVRDDRGLTLPVRGQDGHWLVKLPDQRYPRVPENEWSMMTWARRGGLDVPEIDLVDLEHIRGLPERFRQGKETLCYAIRRFDRPGPGQRCHIEDFAQVLDLYASEKYKKYNYETIAKLVFVLCGREDLRQFVRRLVFIILSGNADAHHKNWSLRYEDGRRPRLSPVYDLVTMLPYPSVSQRLALNLNRSKDFKRASIAGFQRMASRIGFDPDTMAQWVREDIEQIRGAWSECRQQLRLDDPIRRRIDEHLQRVLIR